MTANNILKNTSTYRKTLRGMLVNIYHHMKYRQKSLLFNTEQFYEWSLSQSNLGRLYDKWVTSGFKAKFKPTVDRINCVKPYELSNMHFMTWEENRYKQRMELKRVRARTVYQICKTSNKIVNVYKSVSEAVKFTGFAQGNISTCLSGKRKTCCGYIWSYQNPELLEVK